MVELFGRTNVSVPDQWLSLRAPESEAEGSEMADVAVSSGSILDISPAPARWGHELRGKEARLMSFSGTEFERSVDETHAYDLTSAQLIETLSAIGRPEIEFFFLRLRRAVEEYQINGALGALATAKRDGLIGNIGLFVDGPALAVSGVWRFHDAFECVMVRRNPRFEADFQMVSALAAERRVGVVTCRPYNWGRRDLSIAWPVGDPFSSAGYLAWLRNQHPVLLGVRSRGEIEMAMDRTAAPVELGDDSLARYEDPGTWADCLSDGRPWVREAVAKVTHATV